MKRTLTLLMVSPVLALVLCGYSAYGRPNLSTIERAFNLYPGARTEVVAQDGQHYTLQFQRLEDRGGGNYAVIVHLVR